MSILRPPVHLVHSLFHFKNATHLVPASSEHPSGISNATRISLGDVEGISLTLIQIVGSPTQRPSSFFYGWLYGISVLSAAVGPLL